MRKSSGAIRDLNEQRLKVSRFSELNDPFELVAAGLGQKKLRQRFEPWKNARSDEYGVLCFTTTWTNPVMWSHYADEHKGMCLGFDVPDDLLTKVDYRPDRLAMTENDLEDGEPSRALLHRLVFAKYDAWSYEAEVRIIVPFAEPPRAGKLQFKCFDQDLKLTEVIVGARCEKTKKDIQAALKGRTDGLELKRARLAFKTFDVVTQLRGLQ